jgi:hypothetical protein
MTKKLKIYLDVEKAPKGWILVKSFSAFSLLLDTVNLKDIDSISFSDNIQDDDEDSIGGFMGSDCAIRLIQVAGGHPLPLCFVHGGSDTIAEALNHYNASYNHNNSCIRVKELV